jgi:hypothetical protein
MHRYENINSYTYVCTHCTFTYALYKNVYEFTNLYIVITDMKILNSPLSVLLFHFSVRVQTIQRSCSAFVQRQQSVHRLLFSLSFETSVRKDIISM